ncbi:penicillin acylase family protein [Flavobacteriaceae bacterium]|nr:penicillin acylase family protein [Flavobacteriaceae bacterium]
MLNSIKIRLVFSIIFTLNSSLFAQINPKSIEIVRDAYGIPHIFAKTDAEVAYGLAWAHAEDDFKTIQQSYLAGNYLLSKQIGKKGIPADFLAQFIRSEELVDLQYDKQTSSEYKKILEAYAAGINRYAETHPEEVLSKELFPVTPKKMMRYGQLQLFISSKGDYWVSKILENDLNYSPSKEEVKGSNTFAFNSSKTKDGNTYLAINTHQPLDGPVSWYEAHLCSDEGTNILGALFAGSPSILIGANEHLGWAHTVNQPDKTDVFALEMHPNKKNIYLLDGEELQLESFKAKMNIKVLGIPIKISKKYYRSIFGPTLKNKSGYYSIRTPALFEIRGLEQWWRMNKATSFKEFYDILKMQALPGYNIGYADKNDTIFYISNGLIPKRSEGYNWKEVVPGNTRKTLWTETYEIEKLPQVIQPESGYFYNTNHSPFKSTDEKNNPNGELFSLDMGFERYDNNRSIRLKELIDAEDKVSYEDFKRIKYDRQYPEKMNFSWMDINALFEIDPKRYPDIAPLIRRIQTWDKKADANSKGAGIFGVLYYGLYPYYDALPEPKIFPETILVQGLRDSKAYLLKHFKTLDITLGDFQKLVRGDKELPIYGLPDVLTSMSAKPYKDGKVKVVSGESYIELVRFTPEGTLIESSISYGSSDHPDSPHYDDQMEIYSQFKTKKMSLDKENAYRNAKRIYHPK